MDREMLLKWKAELEKKLIEVEKGIAELESERRAIRESLGAIAVLLGTSTEGSKPEARSDTLSLTETTATADFLSILRERGWSISPKSGKRNSFVVVKKDKSVVLWIKFSRYHEDVNKYWFGISPEQLEKFGSLKGGVVLLLGSSRRHVSFTPEKLLQVLQGATKTKTGQQKFLIQEYLESMKMLPAGTGEWRDITRYSGSSGLRALGLFD